MALPSAPTSPSCCPACTTWSSATSTFCMWAYQVVSDRGPVLTLTSQGPAQLWLVSMVTVPPCEASTGVPQGTEKSVPVCQLDQWLPASPQLRWSASARSAGTGNTTVPAPANPELAACSAHIAWSTEARYKSVAGVSA